MKPSSQTRFRSELVAITGLAVKSIFVAMTYYLVFVALSSPNSNTLVYGLALLGAGAFLTGLIVGYLMKDRTRATTTGFLCALIPTLVFSYSAGRYSPNPIGWVLFAFLFVPLDIFAVAGAVLGRLVKPRIFGAVVLSVLILTSLLLISAYSAAPLQNYNDLILGGDETFTIQGGSYLMHGNISLSGNASLTISESKFYMVQDASKSRLISLSGNSEMLVKDSTCSSITSRFFDLNVSIILYDNASVTMDESSILGYTLISYNSSSIDLLNCVLTSPTNARDASTLRVSGSTDQFQDISGYDFAQIIVTGSDISAYFGYGNSSASITNSKSLGLFISDTSRVRASNSSLYTIATKGLHGAIDFSRTNVTNGMTVDDASNFYMSGTVAFTPLQNVESNGTLTRNYDVNTAPNTLLDVTNSQSQALLLEFSSDSAGHANFNITYTASNYTDTCLMNQKPFNLTSTTPLTYP